MTSYPRIRVSQNRRFLETETRHPFFWLGDTAQEIGVISSQAPQTFTPPTGGPDWVLVVDDASRDFSAPGKAGQTGVDPAF